MAITTKPPYARSAPSNPPPITPARIQEEEVFQVKTSLHESLQVHKRHHHHLEDKSVCRNIRLPLGSAGFCTLEQTHCETIDHAQSVPLRILGYVLVNADKVCHRTSSPLNPSHSLSPNRLRTSATDSVLPSATSLSPFSIFCLT